RGDGNAFGIVELAVVLARSGEHPLGAPLVVDDGEEVVARVGDEEAPVAQPGDAADLLGVERPLLAGELDRRRRLLAGDAPQGAAIALDKVDRAVGRER